MSVIIRTGDCPARWRALFLAACERVVLRFDTEISINCVIYFNGGDVKWHLNQTMKKSL